MNWTTVVSENHRRKPLLLGMLSPLIAFPASAKLATDFNPDLDFSKYKTFAYSAEYSLSSCCSRTRIC